MGDNTGRAQLTPVAVAAGRRLCERLFNNKPDEHLDYSGIATVVFSHPVIGTVGLTEAEAVAEDLGVDAKVVRQMEGRMSSYDTSFDAELDGDDEAIYRAPAYYLEDQGSDIAANVEDAQWEKITNHNLSLAMNELDERSQDILKSRWLGDEKSTLHELAGKYGVSAERIRQLEKNAMNKIKAHMAA